MIESVCQLTIVAGFAFCAPQNDELSTLEMDIVTLPLRDGGHVVVERGNLSVPIVRANPESKRITIDVWRFPAVEGADPDTPPIFQLNGGPGWPGLELGLGDYEDDILPLIQHQDLVIVGQRGIGSSKPDTACPPIPAPPAGETRTPEQEDQALVAACKACRAHWEAEGYDLRGLNVIEAAGDVDDIREWLGYDQITLWGGSFGSHWSMAVMRYHPEAVARAVLTGMEGPDHTYDMPSGVLASLERLAAEAELSSTLIPHIPEGGLIEAFKTVIERVEAEPVVVEVDGETVRFDADDVRSLALGYTARVSSRSGAPTWPADILALYAGDFERAARSRSGGTSNLPTASFFMLDCGSGITPERLEKLHADPAARVVGDLGHWYETACSAWDSDLGDDFRAGFTTDIPTVIVHGTWDTSTPFDNAIELLPSFEDLHFVIVEGGSHGALGEAMRFSAEFRAAVMKFVATGIPDDLPEEVVMPPVAFAPPY